MIHLWDIRYPVDSKYSFHWQRKDEMIRIDTAPHHNQLSTYPRHFIWEKKIILSRIQLPISIIILKKMWNAYWDLYASCLEISATFVHLLKNYCKLAIVIDVNPKCRYIPWVMMPAAPSHQGCGWNLRGARGVEWARCRLSLDTIIDRLYGEFQSKCWARMAFLSFFLQVLQQDKIKAVLFAWLPGLEAVFSSRRIERGWRWCL